MVAHVDDAKCLAALNKNGVPCSAYRTVAEALADPQIAHRGALAEVRMVAALQGHEPAVPDVGSQCLRGKAGGDPGRTHVRSPGDRSFDRKSQLLGKTPVAARCKATRLAMA